MFSTNNYVSKIWAGTYRGFCKMLTFQANSSNVSLYSGIGLQSFTPSIQDLMNQLHWLPIQARIDFKIATLTYKALSSGQPAYLRELISPYKPWRQLRSSDQSLLTIPRTNLTIGQHAFFSSSVFIWNSIPLSVRNAPTISTFKRRLKTFYFSSISS